MQQQTDKSTDLEKHQTPANQIIKPENYDVVIEHMRNNFFLDEPVMAKLHITPKMHEEFTLNTLKEGLSLMAVSQDGQILGAAINGIGHPEDLATLEQLTLDLEATDPALHVKLSLLVHLEKQSDIHRRFGVEKSFEVHLLSVDREYRGLGIATELLQASQQLAHKLEFPIMHIDCLSEFTARGVHKLGWQQVFSVRYDQFQLQNYEEPPLMNMQLPHQEAKSYILLL